MRSVWWSLAVVLAFVLGGASVLVAEWSQYRQTASLEQVMEATVTTASNAIFDAVVWVNGEPVNLPKTEADWENVEHGAITLAESADLMMMPGRVKDWGDWRRFAHDLHNGARAAERAALNKNVDEVLQAGDLIYEACTNCHRKYLKPAS